MNFGHVLDEASTVENPDPILQQQLLMEAYDVAYGVIDHDSDPSPLSLVRMSTVEDVTTHSRLYNTIRRYRQYGIRRIYGLSLNEFLELPFDIRDFLLQEAKQTSVQEVTKAEELEEHLNNMRHKA